MRRAAWALAVTVIGVVWLVTFRVTPLPVDAVATEAPAPTGQTRAPQTGTSAASTQAPATSAQAGSAAAGTFTGSTIRTVYGDVQVRVSIAGGRIMDVQAVTLPSDRARSAYISQVAGPMLRSEAIRAQNANIDVISGATYTSIAYARSLDSALKQAHLG